MPLPPRLHRSGSAPSARRRAGLRSLFALLLTLVGANAVRAQIVIRQLYGGGGQLYDRDFVELFNRGDTSEVLDGLSLQYASATGTGLFSGGAPTRLSGSLEPGRSLLVGLAASPTGSGIPLPLPYFAGNPATNLAATSGKLALVRGVDGLPCNGGSTPCSPAWQERILDLVGYGAADFFEGDAAAPVASATLALQRADEGCRDTWANAADFVAGAPVPRNSDSPPGPCPPGTRVELSASADFASESERSIVLLTATAASPVLGAQSLSIVVGGGPGVSSEDYRLSTSTLALLAGETSASALFEVVDDPIAEGSERVAFVLADFPPGLRPGASIHRALVVADDDGCGLPATPIHAIQGSGAQTPLAGEALTIEGVVVGRLFGGVGDALQGFFVEAEDVEQDGDPATSEGLFIDAASGGLAAGLAVGDRVRVSGTARERSGRTVLEALTNVELCGRDEPMPTAASLALPITGIPSGDLAAALDAIDARYEPLESMRVHVAGPLVVAESFELQRFGRIALDQGSRIRSFTDAAPPSIAGFVDHQIGIARGRLLLDDGDDGEDSALIHGRPLPFPTPGLSISNRFRSGDRISNLTGVLDGPSSSSGGSASGGRSWRIRAVPETASEIIERANPRPAAPPVVPGSLRVVSFNVGNYFATIDTTPSNSSGPCGPAGSLDCRGADSPAELARQTAKLVAALCRLEPDLIGLVEMENDDDATSGLIAAANAVAGCGPFDFVPTGPIGSDAIRVALVFKTTSAEAIGPPAILDRSVDPRFDDFRNRPVVAQTFRELATDRRFTLAVAHLKSKGSTCAFLGDPDTGDGQGNCNRTRRNAAAALVHWLASDPTGSGDPDFLIVGDLNAHRFEDPIRAILAGADDVSGTPDDFIDLVARHAGAAAYNYVFDGQVGRLDHALATATLAAQVAGAEPWAINADEPPAFDYDDAVADAGEAAFEAKPSALPLYVPDEFRTSDHDPLVIGLPEPGSVAGPAILLFALLALVAFDAIRAHATRLRLAAADSAGDPGPRARRAAGDMSIRRDEAGRHDEREVIRGDDPRRRCNDRPDRVYGGVRGRDTEIGQILRVLDREAGAYARDAVDLDDVALFHRPVGLHRLAETPAEPELDDGPAVHDAGPDALQPADHSLPDLHVAEVEIPGRRSELDVEADLVELDLERRRHHLDGIEEDEHPLARLLVEPRAIGRRRESDVEPGLRRGVGRRVDGLEHRDAVDPPTDRRRYEAENVREPGIDARAVERCTAAARGLVEAEHVLLAVGPAGDEVGGGHDVDAGLEQPDHIVDDPLERHVKNTIRLQGKDCADLVRCSDADLLAQATELADILADLVRAPGEAADELEIGMVEDRLDGAAADESGRPLHDAKRRHVDRLLAPFEGLHRRLRETLACRRAMGASRSAGRSRRRRCARCSGSD